jgi:hypothetical protein
MEWKMNDKRTPIKSILDRVIGSVEISKHDPSYYMIKDKNGEIIMYVEAAFTFDKHWNWFDDEMLEVENESNTDTTGTI